MRKIIFILLVLLTTNLFALEIDLGGKMGMGVGWWRGSDYTEDLEILGAANATFGVFTSIEVHEYVSLQAELLFAVIGNRDKVMYGKYVVKRSFKNVAFEFPLYVKPKFEIGPGDMFFLIGPKFLILMDDFNVKQKTSLPDASYEVESDYQIGRQLHLGLSLGFGYEFKLGPGKLYFALEATPYLTNYGKSYFKAIQNEAYFNAGYAFTLKL